PVRVVVDTPGGTSDDPFGNVPLFTYNAPKPAISGITPASGTSAGGTIITVTGSGFTAATNVGFGNPDSPGSLIQVPRSNFLSASDTVIVVPSPAAPPGTVDVVVTTAGGQNAASSADRFTFVKPAGGAPGSAARVAGAVDEDAGREPEGGRGRWSTIAGKATRAAACHRGDRAGGGADHAHQVVAAVGDVQVVGGVDCQSVGIVHRRRDGADHTVGSDLSNSVVARVDKEQVAVAI
ncbi:MAG: hypothetical protein E6I86_16455, partial [Chloroflexi bacterium]